jgi:hypothetical protein
VLFLGILKNISHEKQPESGNKKAAANHMIAAAF